MKQLSIDISKDRVYEEVAQTTSYTGAKMEGDSRAYDRIFTTDADRSQLERFWTESCASACGALKKYLADTDDSPTGYVMRLELSASYDDTLSDSIIKDMESFFVMNITGKWFSFSNKPEAGEYVSAAAGFLESVKRKACFKKKPRRPTYQNVES